MAKKLRKVTTPSRLLMLELLIPWVVMGLAALLALYLDFNDVGITVFALGCGLSTTFAVRLWESRRRRNLGQRLQAKSNQK